MEGKNEYTLRVRFRRNIILIANYFDDRADFVLDDLFANTIYPIVYAHIDGKEKFSFVPPLCPDGMNKFLDSRKGDIRTNAVREINDLKSGNIFCITCIDEPQKFELADVLSVKNINAVQC